MSRGAQGQRIQVPDDLREVLLEFTISYLLEQPPDVVNYAADYFSRLRESRTAAVLAAPDRVGDVDVTHSPDESVISTEEETEKETEKKQRKESEVSREVANYDASAKRIQDNIIIV